MDHVETTAPTPTPGLESPWKWTDVLIIGSSSLVLLLLGAAAIGAFARAEHLPGPQSGAASPVLTLSSAALETLAILFSVYVLGLRRRHLRWADIGFRPTTWGWIAISLGFGVIAIVVSGYAAALVQELLGRPPTNPQAPFLLPAGNNPLTALAMIVLAGVTGPIAEEVLFRGVLYNWLRGHWGVAPSVVVSSLIFAAAHLDIVVGTAAFILGLILALAYEASRSLYPNIAIHILNNAAKLILLYALLAAGYRL